MNGGRLLGRVCAPDQPIRFRSGFGGHILQLFGVSDLIILARFERQGIQRRRAIPRLFLTHATTTPAEEQHAIDIRLDANQFKKFSDFPPAGQRRLKSNPELINEQKHWKGKQPNIGDKSVQKPRKSRPINK